MSKKQRPIKELLVLLLNEVKNSRYPFKGMCISINDMEHKRTIIWRERMSLLFYLNSNKPKDCGAGFWWPPEDVLKRINWINEQIKKL